MGFFHSECKCGCGKQVPRGSDYFLFQSLGLSAALEMLDLLDRDRFESYSKNMMRTGLGVPLEGMSIPALQVQIRNDRDGLKRIAHEGKQGALLSRREVEHTNSLVCEVAIWFEEHQPEDFARIDLVERFSPSQRMIYGMMKSASSSARQEARDLQPRSEGAWPPPQAGEARS